MENKKKKKPLLIPWAILAGVMAVLLIAICIGTSYAYRFQDPINAFFDCQTYELERIGDSEVYDAEYYTSDFVRKDENGNPIYAVDEKTGYRHQIYDDEALRNHNFAMAEKAAAEGITLVWNRDENGGGLPLADGAKVSCFSRSSVDPLYGGGGSGTPYGSSADLFSGLTEAGIQYNKELADFYRRQEARRSAEGHPQNPDPFLMNETPWSRVVQENSGTFSAYGDAAIVMISRYGSEHWGDMFMSGSDTASGRQLDFTPEELDMIEGLVDLKNRGVFDKVVLVLNTCNFVNLGMIKDSLSGIDACLWIGYPGNRGLIALGKILDGEYNPSGRLVDTFAYDPASVPGSVTYGDNRYTDWESFGLETDSGDGHNYCRPYTYITYNEGIYVGYRYYETRYEDTVYNRNGALSSAGTAASSSGWNYEEEVAFPFGTGESYTDFTYSNFRAARDGDTFTLSVDVANDKNGRPGRCVAQFYLQKPYTVYDEQNGVEKSAVELVAFGKTSELDPGASETVTVTVDEELLKSYDAEGYGTYILEAGSYYFAVGDHAHDAINNILAAKGFTEADGMDAAGNADFAREIEIRGNADLLKYATSEVNGNEVEIVNRFDHADWNKSGLNGGTEIVYLSRSDWEGTYPVPVPLAMNDDLAAALAYDKAFAEDPDAVMPVYGADNGMSLVMLRGLAYGDPAWNDLLDQTTFAEQADMLANAYRTTHALTSVNKPASRENDAPMGIRSSYSNGMAATTFPCAPIIAASFDDRLMQEVGKSKGEDVLHCGHHGLYGTGVNMHRIPQGGRNFEYYSEDPYLCGIAAARETAGIQSKGVYCILKHFALNDQELNRWGINTWINEQSIREIYLRPFEYSVTVGGARGMMSGFNRIGAIWAGADRSLCTEVLRGEWGFEGFVISDCQVNPYMSYVDGVLAGNDLWLYSILGEGFHRWENSPTVAQAMRESTHRVLYTVVNSAAMNGIYTDTVIVKIMTWWQKLLIAIIVIFAVATAVFAGLVIQSLARRRLRGKKAAEERKK